MGTASASFRLQAQRMISGPFPYLVLLTSILIGFGCRHLEHPFGETAKRLRPGVPFDARLLTGETQTYRLELQSDEYARLVVQSVDFEPMASIHDPTGRLLLETTDIGASSASKSLWCVAILSGAHEVRVFSRGSKEGGSYRIELQNLRQATEADRLLSVGPALGNTPAPSFRPPVTLAKGAPTQGRMAAGSVHSYSIILQIDEFLDLSVRENDFNLNLSLRDPHGRELFEIGNLDGPPVPERAWHIARESGTHTLSVRAGPAGRIDGDYQVQIHQLRPAGASDREIVRGFRTIVKGQEYYRRGDEESLKLAIDCFSKAARIWQAIGVGSQEAVSLRWLGDLRQLAGDFEQALRDAGRALQLVRSLGEKVQEIDLLNTIGKLQRRLERPEEALQTLRTALKTAEDAGDVFGEAAALNNLGVYHHTKGNLESALVCYRYSLRLFEALKHRSRAALARENIGTVYSVMGNLPVALDSLHSSLQIQKELGSPRDQAYILNQIGWVYYLQKNPHAAIDSYLRALELIRQASDLFLEASLNDRLGTAYRELGLTEKAFDAYQKSLEIAQAFKHRTTEKHTLTNITELYLRRGRFEEAGSYLKAVEKLTGKHLEQPHLLYLNAWKESLAGNFIEAERLAEAAVAAMEGESRESPGLMLKEKYQALRFDYYEFYVDLLMGSGDGPPSQERVTRAFEVSQKIRANGLLEQLIRAQQESSDRLPDHLTERVRSVLAQIRSKLGEASIAKSKFQIVRLERELRHLDIELDRTRYQLQAGSLNLPQLPPLTLRRVQQELLDSETSLLAYFLGRERSYLWLVRTDSIDGFELPGKSEIEDLAAAFHRLLARSKRGNVDRRVATIAQRLGGLLLGPVSQKLNTRRLLIVSDGMLQILPFQALAVSGGNSSGRLLLTEKEVVNVPSIPVLLMQRSRNRERKAASKTVAVIADPVFGQDDPRLKVEQGDTERALTALLERSGRSAGSSGLSRLPWAGKEADWILSLVPEENSLSMVGFEANRDLLLSRDLSPYRIVHFATHGLYYPQVAGVFGIALSAVDAEGDRLQGGGILPVYEIYDLNLRADLVTVSTCQSARGDMIRGEGVFGVTQGFIYAGARRVLVSLWNVRDDATAHFMQKFYERVLSRGMPVSEALRKTQLEFYKGGRWSKPYYWAGFVLQGDYRED